MTRFADLATLRRSISPDVRIVDDAPRPPAYRLTEVKGAPAPAPTEHDEQVALFAWAAENEVAHPELRMLHATPNGGYRPIVTAVKMQQEGQKRGYPDISLDVARGKFHGLRIELKRRKGARISVEQEEWIDRLRYYGYSACVCYGAQEAQQVIMAYLAQEVVQP